MTATKLLAGDEVVLSSNESHELKSGKELWWEGLFATGEKVYKGIFFLFKNILFFTWNEWLRHIFCGEYGK